jgi:trafficking protein particle complex subunit 9
VTPTVPPDTPRSTARSESQSPDITTDPFPNQSLLDILPDTHTQILNLHQRSLVPPSSDPVPPLCFSDHILRLARLLCDINATSDLDANVLQANVLGTPLTRKKGEYSMYPPRGEIARWAMRALGPHIEQESIPIPYRIGVIACLINVMGSIGFHRRRAILMKELLRLIVPQLVQARVVGASESGLHPSASSTVHQFDDNGLISLLESLTKAYGVGIAKDDRSVFGWPSLRNHVLKECILFCEALPHPAGIAHFTSLLFVSAGDELDKEEQIRLASNLPRITANSRKRGTLIEADYWDMFLIQNIEILRAPGSQLQRSNQTARDKPAQGPFLYKARSADVDKDDKVIYLRIRLI